MPPKNKNFIINNVANKSVSNKSEKKRQLVIYKCISIGTLSIEQRLEILN